MEILLKYYTNNTFHVRNTTQPEIIIQKNFLKNAQKNILSRAFMMKCFSISYDMYTLF